MPDQFADVLDRLDITFDDWGPGVNLFDLLAGVLGGSQPGGPSRLQQDIAGQKFQQEAQQALFLNVRVTTFVRQGRQVKSLRDARGRFVTEGAAGISDYLRPR